eukprot:gene20-23_t
MNEISGYLSPLGENSESDQSRNGIHGRKSFPSDEEHDDDNIHTEEMSTTNHSTKKSLKSQTIQSSKSTLSTTKTTPFKPKNIAQYKYIPMRLSEEERKLLAVLENALEVCEYTDVVDVTFSHTRKSKLSRIIESLVDVLSISCGLMVANNLTKGEGIIKGRSLNDNVPLFADLFEIGRRYKVMNPSKMRGTYGKLMYILMDTESYNVKSELRIDFIKPLLTVHSFLKARGCEEILADPLWQEACQIVSDEYGEKSKREVRQLQERKAAAAQTLLQKYTSDKLTTEELQRVMDSIGDNEAYYDFNVKPVDRMLEILTTSFNPSQPEEPYSLHLSSRGGGSKKPFGSFSSIYGYSSSFLGGGAKLSHDHKTQFRFVLQSLTLWREIMANMPMLWIKADMDMTSEVYRLVDTGQGYQRLQSCPRVRQEMSDILQRVQSKAGAWVGLSVVHLGDRDVPNALVFIDKYTQVPRILAPIVQCIEFLPHIAEDPAFHKYVSQEWGSIEGLRMQILSDFFKHGFDGSGDDGGSCIDGRLTSAWNWCSKLHKKPYYHVFMFSGFQGFDGDWKNN